jgi:hypothetical protein
VVLGFSALQLSHAASSGELNLEALAADGLITAASRAPIVLSGTDSEVAALGYLHANCGNCHNSARPPTADHFRPRPTLDLWLTVDSLSDPRATPTYRTAIGQMVRPGAPATSPLLRRMQRDGVMVRRMPPLATEQVDTRGVAIVTRWIEDLGRR